MAPLKMSNKNITGLDNIPSMGVCTRSRNGSINLKSTLKQAVKAVGKRKAGSPLRDAKAKRAAFGDITNAIANITVNDKDKNVLPAKRVTAVEKNVTNVKVVKRKQQENKVTVNSKKVKNQILPLKSKPLFPSSNIWPMKNNFCPVSTVQNGDVQKSVVKNDKILSKPNGFNSFRQNDEMSEESLYISATEDMSNDSKHLNNSSNNKTEKDSAPSEDIDRLAISVQENLGIPDDINDFDKENWNDHFQVSHYAMDIFNYLKDRETKYVIEDYLPRQKNLTNWMRALLIDWMVEVQESFELNHETLYLAVKLVDSYLCKVNTKKDELQLLGAASLFIASKFDERIPPLIADFLYICDGAYTLRQLLAMEINVLKTIGFDLGIPLSYRFLRRYARCARVTMPTLTLARYVLELCLMEYAMISLSDSKMAAAALYLAIKMKNLGSWTPSHVYYTGYKLEDILPVVRAQNICLHKKPKEALSTVRNKYSHRIFFEVAKIPLISNDDLT